MAHIGQQSDQTTSKCTLNNVRNESQRGEVEDTAEIHTQTIATLGIDSKSELLA